MRQDIRVLIYPDETGGYNGRCDDLSAYSQGGTIEQALANMREALSLALEDESMAELGFVEDPSLLIEIEAGPARPYLGTPEVRRAG